MQVLEGCGISSSTCKIQSSYLGLILLYKIAWVPAATMGQLEPVPSQSLEAAGHYSKTMIAILLDTECQLMVPCPARMPRSLDVHIGPGVP